MLGLSFGVARERNMAGLLVDILTLCKVEFDTNGLPDSNIKCSYVTKSPQGSQCTQ
jgi:hypothetical protein